MRDNIIADTGNPQTQQPKPANPVAPVKTGQPIGPNGVTTLTPPPAQAPAPAPVAPQPAPTATNIGTYISPNAGQLQQMGIVKQPDGSWSQTGTQQITPEQMQQQLNGIPPGFGTAHAPQAPQAPTPQAPPLPTPIPQANGVSLSTINPSSDLRGQLITPGAGTDRYGIAQQQLSTYNQATDPIYQQSLREATSQAAGAGRLGSGQLRTSLGDLALNRSNDLSTHGQNFLTNALNGSIGDAYNNIGIAQQQQARQDNAQNTAFGQGVTQTGLQDSLKNSATNRSLAQLSAGNQGNPADTDLTLANLYGGQAAQGGQALNGLIGNTVANNSQASQTNALQQILRQLGLSQGGVNTQGAIPQGTIAPDGGYYSGGVLG